MGPGVHWCFGRQNHQRGHCDLWIFVFGSPLVFGSLWVFVFGFLVGFVCCVLVGLLVDFALECECLFGSLVFFLLAGWAVSGGWLSASLPWRVHFHSINPIFYGGPVMVSFQGVFRA